MINYPQMYLGKQEKKLDNRNLLFKDYLNKDLPALPAEYYYSRDISKWGMMLNDTIGDCTVAAVGHAIMSVTDDNHKEYVPSNADIIGAYSAITGYVPGEPWTDNGAYCLDVLKYWKNTGVSGKTITAFAEINMYNSHEVQYAIWLFGFVYIGVQLPIATQSQQDIWHMGPNKEGIYAPGSWGGHCVIATGFDKDGFDIITWGQRIRMTWNFWYAYVDEAYAVISPDFFNENVAPNGFNLLQLEKDLTYI